MPGLSGPCGDGCGLDRAGLLSRTDFLMGKKDSRGRDHIIGTRPKQDGGYGDGGWRRGGR